jgi:O-antigen/teichoic acid export membrane protein
MRDRFHPINGGRRWLRSHLSDQLYRTGYLLIIGTGVTSLLGMVFWALAAHAYPAHDVGTNAAVISAMTLVSGACSLGLSAVLVRYLPVAGLATKRLIVGSYLLTIGLSFVFGALIAITSDIWSSDLSFLGGGVWLVGFTLATAATTVFTLQDSVLTGLHTARWIPVENSLYSAGKLVLLVALAAALPSSGLFVAWTAPLLPALLIVSYLIFRRLVPNHRSFGSLDRRKVLAMAAGNYGGNLFSLAGTLYLPILVANRTSPTEAAFFYIPWLISLSLQLIALNMMASLTVTAVVDLPRLRQLARRAIGQSFRLLLPLILVGLIAAPLFLRIFGSEYSDAGTSLLRWLLLGGIPNVIVALGVTVGRIEHRGAVVLLAQGANSVIVIGLSALLISGSGITGVGIAFTTSQTLIALLLGATVLRPLLNPKPAGGQDSPSHRPPA